MPIVVRLSLDLKVALEVGEALPVGLSESGAQLARTNTLTLTLGVVVASDFCQQALTLRKRIQLKRSRRRVRGRITRRRVLEFYRRRPGARVSARPS